MATTLEQPRHLVNRKSFTLQDTGVLVEEKTMFKRRRFKIPFESIPTEGVEVTTNSKVAFTAAALLSVFGVLQMVGGLTPAYLLVAIPFAVWYALSKSHYIVYDCGGPVLLFYKNIPAEDEVTNFLQLMQQQKQDYLRKNYPPTRSENLIEDLQRLAYLKNSGSLTEEEFTRMKAALLEDNTAKKGQIGFTNPEGAT